MLPLEGIKVVDLTTWAFAPVSTAFLGDWGANVIKVEDPRTGDPIREYMRYLFQIDDSNWPVTLYDVDNRNKRGVAVDLRQQQGREIIYKLVEKADVFVTNLQRGSLERLGMTYESLSAINPRLIYGHASGYGERGPEKDKPGYDGLAYWARSGMMSSFSTRGEPVFPQHHPAIGDQVSGLVLAGGLILALFMRERTGIGQEVDVSLLGVGTWVSSLALQIVLSTGGEPPCYSRETPGNPLVNVYKTKDDWWIILVNPATELYWPRLCKAIGREDVEHDPRFSSHQKIIANSSALTAILEEAMLTRTAGEWGKIFDENGLIWGHLPATYAEVANDPQVLANDYIVEVDHPRFGRAKIVSTPVQLNKAAPQIRRLAPELGQHTEEVLLELGYSREDIVKLRKEGVIL